MAKTLTMQIKTYDITYYGGGKRIAQPYPYRAIIALRDAAAQIISGLYFHADSSTIPPGDSLPDSGQPMVHFPVEDFARVVDLLRNEGPVYYHQLSNWPSMGWVSTSLEPVGEGEPGGP